MDFATLERQLKDGFHAHQQAFELFKKANDERLDRLEKKGQEPSGEQKETIARLEKAMDDIAKKMEKTQAALNRPTVSGNGLVSDPAEVKSAFAELMKRAHPSQNARGVLEKVWEAKGLTVGTDSDGGFLVTPEVQTTINHKVFESSPIRQLAEVVTIGTERLEERAVYSEASSGWLGEGGTASSTGTPTLGNVAWPTHKLYAYPFATQELLDDAFMDVEAWLANEVYDKFARDEATAFVTGNGVARPRGFTTYANGTGFNQVEQINSGVSGDIPADSLYDVQTALFEDFQPNATWLMARATMGLIRKLKDGDGRYLMSQIEGLKGGLEYILLGRPVRFAADMAAVGAGSLSVAYGDFRQGYRIVDRIGIRVLRNPFSTLGSVGFFTTKRVGGGVRKFQAIKLLKLS